MPVFGTQMFGSTAGDYEIDYSCRFNQPDSPALTRTLGTPTNRKIWTFSAWIKQGAAFGGDNRYIFSAHTSGSDAGFLGIWMKDDNRLALGGWSTDWRFTTSVYRDTAAHMHICVGVDTTQSVAGDRIKIEINGVELTAFDSSTNPTLNYEFVINSATQHVVGGDDSGAPDDFWDGYMAEVVFIDGTPKTASDFGETNDDGVWVPKKYAGAYGDNGFNLDFADSSALGNDVSGEGNDFASSGLASADQMPDTPTKNYCVMNAVDPSADEFTLTEGNLRTTSGDGAVIRSTFLMESGKWYWESQTSSSVTDDASPRIGIQLPDSSSTSIASTGGYAIDCDGGKIYNGSSATATSTTVSANDYFSFAYDADAEKLWIGKVVSGTRTWLNPGGSAASDANVTSGTNATYTSVTAPRLAAMEGHDERDQGTDGWNFGQKTFQGNSGTPPTDFVSLDTSNIAAPDIKDPSGYFQTELYTGNGTAIGSGGNAITFSGNSSMQPDFVWIKNRDADDDHSNYDSVRGTTKQLEMNSTDTETTESESLTTFGSDGFTVGSLNQVNTNTENFVAWCWKGDGTAGGTLNEVGDINSQVNVNTTAGFSIVGYTGNGSDSQTIGHGLGVTPQTVLVLPRSSGDHHLISNWETGVTAFSEKLKINDREGATSSSTQVKGGGSTTFTVGTDGNINGSGSTYIAYCFANVEGFSKLGTYTGNGNADGPFVYCGFRPRLIVIKAATATESWPMYDAAINSYNSGTTTGMVQLFTNNTNAESAGSNENLDILSNGFKLRSTNDPVNSSNTYIFMAFAENPFGGSGVAPAPAR